MAYGMEDKEMGSENDPEEKDEACSEKASELLDDVMAKYPDESEIISKIEEIIQDLTEVEGGSKSKKVESPEEEPTNYEDMNHEDMRKDMHKKGMIIAVRVK